MNTEQKLIRSILAQVRKAVRGKDQVLAQVLLASIAHFSIAIYQFPAAFSWVLGMSRMGGILSTVIWALPRHREGAVLLALPICLAVIGLVLVFFPYTDYTQPAWAAKLRDDLLALEWFPSQEEGGQRRPPTSGRATSRAGPSRRPDSIFPPPGPGTTPAVAFSGSRPPPPALCICGGRSTRTIPARPGPG